MRQIAFALEGTEKSIGLSHVIIKIYPVKENLSCLEKEGQSQASVSKFLAPAGFRFPNHTELPYKTRF